MRTILLLFFFTMLSCTGKPLLLNTDPHFAPNWSNLDLSKFDLKLGDKIKFEFNENTREGIILDFLIDGNGDKFYGICLLNENKLFGMKHYFLKSKQCLDLLDIILYKETGLDQIVKIDKYKIDLKTINLGGVSSAASAEELEWIYNYGVNKRKSELTDCEKGPTIPNAVLQCYYPLSSILR